MAVIPGDSDQRRTGSGGRSNMLLHNGDCLTQGEFHALYEELTDFRAELLDGVVFVAEPLGLPHGTVHVQVTSLLYSYRVSTPGVQVCDNTTVILGPQDEVQPDLFMRILPEFNGQSTNSDDHKYVTGAPELMVEIALSSRSIDLHLKKRRYENAGVKEYLVVCLQSQEIIWFNLAQRSKYKAIDEQIFCSQIFPGLCIHQAAVFALDDTVVMDTLNRGLASAEHQQFVDELTSRVRRT